MFEEPIVVSSAFEDPILALTVAAIRAQTRAAMAEILREGGLCTEQEYHAVLEQRDEFYASARAAGIPREDFVVIPPKPTRLVSVPAGNGLYRLQVA